MAETKRQRGAQPGNDNARKHGRYCEEREIERSRRRNSYQAFREVVRDFEELLRKEEERK